MSRITNTNTYCPLPWVHKFVLPTGDEIPCCSYKDKNHLSSFSHIKNKMLNGKKVDGCSRCYENEKVGIKSMRQDSIEKYGITTHNHLKSLEVAFDNICNFKCRSCSSMHSHLIRKDETLIYGQSLFKEKLLGHDLQDKINYKNLEKFKVHGGEPLISPKFNSFCKKLYTEGNVSTLDIDITTNGSVIPNESVCRLIESVFNLTINISIDGLGDLNNYIRTLSKWEEISSNLDFFDGLIDIRKDKRTNINIHTTVSIYNVNKLHELDNFIYEYFPRFSLTKQCVSYPESLAINNLPSDYKELIRPYLENYKDVEKFLLKEPSAPFDYCAYIIVSLDNLRNTTLEGKNNLLFEYLQKFLNESYDENTSLEYHDKVKDRIENKKI